MAVGDDSLGNMPTCNTKGIAWMYQVRKDMEISIMPDETITSRMACPLGSTLAISRRDLADSQFQVISGVRRHRGLQS